MAQGQKRLLLEAMTRQTVIYAERAGQVAEVCVHPGKQVETGDLLMALES